MGDSQNMKDWVVKQFPVAALVLGAFFMGSWQAREAGKEHVQFEERLTKAMETLTAGMSDLHADVNRAVDVHKG